MVSIVVPRITLLGPKALAGIAITLLPLGGCADLIGLEDLGSGSGAGLGGAGGRSTGGDSGDSGGNGSGGEASGDGGSSSGGSTSGDGGTSSGGSGGNGGSGGEGGGSGGGDGGTPGCAVDLTDDITDDFTDEAYTQQCWASYNTGLLDGEDWQQDTAAGGTLSGVPDRGRSWYNGGTAPILYQPVSGSFLVEATVSVREPGGDERSPDHEWASAGLLVIPANADFTDAPFVDYYAIKAGTHDPATSTGFKGEYTALVLDNDNLVPRTRRTLVPPVVEGAWNQSRIRVCRVDGRLWTGYWNGSAWTGVHYQTAYNEHGYPLDDTEDELPQLDDEVWVGLGAEAYTLSTMTSPEGALIIFHQVTFRRVDALADCRD